MSAAIFLPLVGSGHLLAQAPAPAPPPAPAPASPAAAAPAAPAVGNDEIRVEGGKVFDGQIIREDEVSIFFKLTNYGVIQIPKYMVRQISRGGKVEPTPIPKPVITPVATPGAERKYRSRLDIGKEPKTADGATTGTLNPATAKAGDMKTTGSLQVAATKPADSKTSASVAGAKTAMPTTAAQPPAARPGAAGASAAKPAAGSPAAPPAPAGGPAAKPAASGAAPAAAPPAAVPAGAPTASLDAIVKKLEKGEILEVDEAKLMLDLKRKARTNPGGMTDLEKKAVQLMK